jgi:putative flippase GtrA
MSCDMPSTGSFSEQRPLHERLLASALLNRIDAAYVRKVVKYAIGSLLALATSTAVFALLLLVGSNNTTIDSVAAFVAGAIPNWVLNRRWAWERTGKIEIAREVIGYSIVSLVALVASSLGTGWTQSWVRHHVAGGTGARTLLITGAYVAVQALLFVGKFVVYDRWVFTGRSRLRRAVRSRRQVWTTARVNRTP